MKQKVSVRVYKLTEPVHYGDGEMLDQLEIRKPVTRDMLVLYQGLKIGETPTLERMVSMLAEVTGQPDKLIGQMDWVDVTGALEVMNGFFPSGPQTGKNG